METGTIAFFYKDLIPLQQDMDLLFCSSHTLQDTVVSFNLE